MTEKRDAGGDRPTDTMRIARYLARCGVASRRKAEDIIRQGRVSVNGEIIADLGRQVTPGVDRIYADGEEIVSGTRHLTIALNKPVSVVVTRDDPEGRKTVYDLLPPNFKERAGELVYCGRLDFYSAGLLIMTTDGELAHRMMHPRHHVSKTYIVCTNEPLTPEDIEKLQSGIEIEDYKTNECKVREARARDNRPTYEIVLNEGRNRQIRKMIESIGKKVSRLQRVAIGNLRLNDLRIVKGQSIELTANQLQQASRDDQAPPRSRA